MATVYVNEQAVTIGDNERLNCIQAAARSKVDIPHYCWHPQLSVVASCRMCLVEVGDKKPDGTVAMQPKVVPGCQTPVKDGTVIVTNSQKVRDAQKATLEYLLLNHPLDCPVCDQAGECGLQDYSFNYGRGYSRLQEPKNIKPDKDYIGDQITLFTDRCIMCTRCVRFTREFSGTAEMQVVSRGTHEEIDIFPGIPCNNKLAGNVVDLCPVGALCSKDFLYEQRVWFLQNTKSVCTGCSTGCSINVDQNKDVLYRLKPRVNEQAQGHFMCDEGRFGWKYIHAANRLAAPEMRQNGVPTSRDWDAILPSLKKALEDKVTTNAKGVAAVISPWATVEEAYLLASYLKGLSADVTLAIGQVRTVGEDDHYPKDVHGQATGKARFTIRAEKAPNRTGVSKVLEHYQGSVVAFADVLSKAKSGQLDTVYVLGGDPELEWSSDEVAALKSAKLLVVQDLLANSLTQAASVVLAGSSFAEKDGTYINHAGLAQAIRRAMHGPEDARPDGRILWDLSGRRGLFHAGNLRKEIAQAIPSLSALICGDLGDTGVMTNQPTGAAAS